MNILRAASNYFNSKLLAAPRFTLALADSLLGFAGLPGGQPAVGSGSSGFGAPFGYTMR